MSIFKKSDLLTSTVLFFGAFLVASYLLSLGARAHWLLDLFRHFLHQYFVGSLLLVPLLFWKKQYVLAAAVILVSCASFYEIYSALDVSAGRSQESIQTIKVAQYNRLYTLSDHSEMQSWIEGEAPDFFVIQEASELHAQSISDLGERYPHQIHEPRENGLGLVIASKHEIIASSVHKTDRYAMDVFFVHALIKLQDGNLVSAYTVHPPPPISRLMHKQRNEDIQTVASAILNDKNENIVFLGDLNITPYSPYFRDFIKDTGLKNQYSSPHLFPTWPSIFASPFFQIPIDHILHKGRMELVSKHRAPHMGSDHYPVVAEFSIPD